MDIKGGEYQGLKYTVAQPKSNYPSGPGKPIHARAKAFVWAVKWLNKLSLKPDTEAKVEHLHPDIKKATDQGKVVMVVLQFVEWPHKNGAGDMQQLLHYAYIGAIAPSRHRAFFIHKYQQGQPLIKPAPPKGWVNGNQLVLWFENDEKRKEQSKYDQGNLDWDVVI